MSNDMSAGDPVSDARLDLAGLLDAIKRVRADIDEGLAQLRRLDGIKQAEANVRVKLDAIKQRDVRELSDQLINPTGLHITVDHFESTETEWEFDRARREADVARACEPEVNKRLADANGRLAELEAGVIQRAADIALEEAELIAREIDADAARLRAKYACLWGLWVFLGDAKLYRHAERAARANHPDNICPSGSEVHRAAPIWRKFTERLASDPAACMEDGE